MEICLVNMEGKMITVDEEFIDHILRTKGQAKNKKIDDLLVQNAQLYHDKAGLAILWKGKLIHHSSIMITQNNVNLGILHHSLIPEMNELMKDEFEEIQFKEYLKQYFKNTFKITSEKSALKRLLIKPIFELLANTYALQGQEYFPFTVSDKKIEQFKEDNKEAILFFKEYFFKEYLLNE